jgi:hypothetical protein
MYIPVEINQRGFFSPPDFSWLTTALTDNLAVQVFSHPSAEATIALSTQTKLSTCTFLELIWV